MLAQRPARFAALLWWPAWRDVLTPGGPSLCAGIAVAASMAFLWTRGVLPVIPGAAWAFMFSVLAIALTERLQRTMESHLAALSPWLGSLPGASTWRWHVRALTCAPMWVAGAAAVLLVLTVRPWRAGPLVAFAMGLVVAPLAMTAVPSANREAHVSLWAICTGLLTALGSELWN